MMALRANVLAKGYSGIRRATLDRLIDALNARVHPRRAEPRLGRRERRPRAARAPRRSSSSAKARRRWATIPPCSTARAALARAGLAPVDARAPRKGSRSSTARRRRPRSRRWRCSAPSGSPAPPTLRRRCRSTACAARIIPFEARLHDAAPASRASARRPPTCCALLQHSADQPVARELRPRPGRLLDALRAAGPRRRARRVRLRARRARRSKPTPRPTTRWCSPTPGDIVSGGNFHGAPIAIAADVIVLGLRAAGDDLGTALRSAGQSRRSAAWRRS